MSELDELLSGYSDGIATLAREACGFVSNNTVGAKSRVQFGWKVVIYEYEKVFCAVALHKNWVNIQFYAGTELADPSNLLEGSGKSMRHVKIRDTDDLGSDVAALLQAAANHAQ